MAWYKSQTGSPDACASGVPDKPDETVEPRLLVAVTVQVTGTLFDKPDTLMGELSEAAV